MFVNLDVAWAAVVFQLLGQGSEPLLTDVVLPSRSAVKNPPAMQEVQETQVRSLVEKISWGRACNPLQYSYVENPIDRGAWRAVVPGITVSHD